MVLRNGDAGVAESEDCPSAADVALLTAWTEMYAASRQLSGALFGDIERQTGLAPSSFQVLWYLFLAPGHSAPMSALARVLDFSTAGVTKLTDRLADGGLITRVASAEDRRVTLAVLTDEGVQAAQSAAGVLAASIRRRIISVIGDDEFRAVTATLSRLAEPGDDCPCGAGAGS